jgi:tetratricopeptide (TPR) repeat protein
MTDLIKADSAETPLPPFFTVSKFKFIVMSVATLGLYEIYWLYKNWVFIKQKTGRDISPFWRTVFGLFWVYSFFKYIQLFIFKARMQIKIYPGAWAIIYIILALIDKRTANLFPTFLLLLIDIRLNTIATEINRKLIPNFQNNSRFSLGNYIWLVIGGILWLQLIFGWNVNKDLERGDELYENGQYEEAIQAYDKAIEEDPDSSEAYNNKCSALHEIGKYEESIQACDKAIELNPNFNESYNWKGSSLKLIGHYEEALGAFNQSIKLNSKSSSSYNEKGLVLFQMGKYEEAIAAFDGFIKINSKDSTVYFNKARALDEMGKYKEAVESYDKAIKLDSKSNDFYSAKAYALFNLQQYEEALYAYDKAIELDNTSSLLYQNKARILEYLDRDDEAREAYEMAARIEASKELMQSQPADKGRALRELYEIQSNQ